MMAAFSGCRTALEPDEPKPQSAVMAHASVPTVGPGPTRTINPRPVIRDPSKGYFGTYGGSVDSLDESDNVSGSQPFAVTFQPATSPRDPRQVGTLHLVSDGDQFSDVDYSAPVDIRVNGFREADGTLRYEFFTDCKVIPGLTASKVELQMVLYLDPGSSQVDSSQSVFNILDCGFSGNAGFEDSYGNARFSEFGKR